MAEETLQKVEELTNCSICLDTYTNPKHLQCFHVYCQDCLKKLVFRDQQGQLVLTCPNCRQVTPLRDGRVAGLQSAFHINNLLEIIEKHKKGKDESDTENNSPIQSVQEESKLFCTEHADEELKLYCETCGKLICFQCAIKGFGKHHDHNYNFLEKAFEKYKKEINSSLEPVKKQMVTVKKALDELDTCCLRITDQQATTRAYIYCSIERLQAILEVRKTQLFGQLHRITQSKLKFLAAQKDQLETTLAQLGSCHDFLKKSIESDSHRDAVLKMKARVVNQITELTASIQPDLLKPCTEADLLYSPSDDIIADCQNYGQLSEPSIPYPSQCYATGEGLNEATVKESATATFCSVDYKGEPCDSIGSLECELISELSDKRELAKVERIENNKYKISYQPTIKGRHSLHIKVGGQHIKESPFTVAVKSSIEHLGDPFGSIKGINRPWGVALTEKHECLVSVQRDHCIHVFSPDGKKLPSYGSHGSGQGQFKNPTGVAVNEDGNIFVVDTGNHRVQKFTADGEFLTAVGERGIKNLEFDRPDGIAVSFKRNKVYVADSVNNRIQVLTSDLDYSSSFGSMGSGEGQFQNPKGIACDCEREVLYVADQANNRIQVFTEEGKFVKEFGSFGNGEGEVNRPSCVAVDSNGMVYVSEAENHRISVFSPDGKFLKSFGGSEILKSPCGLVVDSNGVVYVCDINANCTLMF